MNEIRFTVNGKSQPAGSKKAFGFKNASGGISSRVVDANKNNKPWQAEVKAAALEAYQGPLLNGALSVAFIFVRVRPKGHFKKSGELSKEGRENPSPTTKPDLLKTARGIEDALTGIIYRDDSQIVEEYLRKEWGERECVKIVINDLEPH